MGERVNPNHRQSEPEVKSTIPKQGNIRCIIPFANSFLILTHEGQILSIPGQKNAWKESVDVSQMTCISPFTSDCFLYSNEIKRVCIMRQNEPKRTHMSESGCTITSLTYDGRLFLSGFEGGSVRCYRNNLFQWHIPLLHGKIVPMRVNSAFMLAAVLTEESSLFHISINKGSMIAHHHLMSSLTKLF